MLFAGRKPLFYDDDDDPLAMATNGRPHSRYNAV
jgi:hypothetical protein